MATPEVKNVSFGQLEHKALRASVELFSGLLADVPNCCGSDANPLLIPNSVRILEACHGALIIEAQFEASVTIRTKFISNQLIEERFAGWVLHEAELNYRNSTESGKAWQYAKLNRDRLVVLEAKGELSCPITPVSLVGSVVTCEKASNDGKPFCTEKQLAREYHSLIAHRAEYATPDEYVLAQMRCNVACEWLSRDLAPANNPPFINGIESALRLHELTQSDCGEVLVVEDLTTSRRYCDTAESLRSLSQMRSVRALKSIPFDKRFSLLDAQLDANAYLRFLNLWEYGLTSQSSIKG